MKFKNSVLSALLMVCIFILSCSKEQTEKEILDDNKICEKVCNSGFKLNSDDCSCEEVVIVKDVCEKTCSDGFELDDDKCECFEKEEPFVPVIVTMETETATISGNWHIKTDIQGYKGTGYIEWGGAPSYKQPNLDNVLTYKINITKAGSYSFKWRSYIAKIDPDEQGTGHNDSWVSFPDADDFFAVRDKEGEAFSRKKPQSNKSFFFKAYMNTLNKWNNWCGTVDFKTHGIYATFNTPGEYTVKIAPRSDHHAIDQFSLTLVNPSVRLN